MSKKSKNSEDALIGMLNKNEGYSQESDEYDDLVGGSGDIEAIFDNPAITHGITTRHDEVYIKTTDEEPEEEVEPGIELLTAGDDGSNDPFEIDMSLKDIDIPVKPQTQLRKALYNRSRRRTHGASKTHLPDFEKMTSNDSDSMNDPFDSSWMKSVVSNPFGESIGDKSKQPLSHDVKTTLAKMNKRFGRTQVTTSNVLLEAPTPIQDEIDIELEDVDDE